MEPRPAVIGILIDRAGRFPLAGLALSQGAALIFALALVASYLPARRAMGVDPIVALRHE